MSAGMRATFVSIVVSGIAINNAWGAKDLPLHASSAVAQAETSIPYGWMDFCWRHPEECKVPTLPDQRAKLDARVWTRMKEVNRTANESIEPVSNLEHWGTMADHWDYPVDGKGDCKIYALYKRKLLLDAGLPRQALLMTIVEIPTGERHAILTVRTDHGDFVLDNLTDEVRAWDKTGYRFIKRQSQNNPNVWLRIDDRGDRPGSRL